MDFASHRISNSIELTHKLKVYPSLSYLILFQNPRSTPLLAQWQMPANTRITKKMDPEIGDEIDSLITMNEPITIKNSGSTVNVLYGLFISGSLYRKTKTPATVTA